MTDAIAKPAHLLAIDVAALGGVTDGSYSRLADRLDAIRAETVLVYLDGHGFGALPDPDYRIEGDDTTILRAPGSRTQPEHPAVEASTITAGLDHLAAELLIPPSEVFAVLGADKAPEEGSHQVVVVGGPEAPTHGVWVAEPDEVRIIEALHDIGLLGRIRPASAADVCDAAFEAAIAVVRRNVHELGFSAATPERNDLRPHEANYAAVWARDGVITGLWTLCLDDDELTACFERTLRLMARHQSPAGQIPTNVRLASGHPDYSGVGGIAGIDSVLWFVIGAARLTLTTGNRSLAEDLIEAVEAAMVWLAAHDSNNNGLIEVPESGDWMDLFPRSYNVLYDEVLWYEANLHTAALTEALGRDGARWAEYADRARDQIVSRFWPSGEQLEEITGTTGGKFSVGEANYLLSQITPFDYGWRCDVYANLLAVLSGLLDDHQAKRLFTFLWGVGVNSPYPVTSLYPPIHSGADDWKDYFLVNFLNLPGHYHNGGIWPFIGGLWVRYLASMGRVELAHREMVSLAEACRQGIDGEWEFNEWLHGTTGRPMGKVEQAWSAASYIHAYQSLYGDAPAEMFPDLPVSFPPEGA